MAAMTSSIVDGPAIIVGYQYRLQIDVESDLFPAAAIFAGKLLDDCDDP